MILEINDEEQEFLIRVCERAKIFAKINILKAAFIKNDDMEKIESLLKKISEAKKHEN